MIEGRTGALQPGVEVLVVDDEPMVRDFIARVLTRNGYSSRAVGDAGEALAAMNDRAPTLVISDIRMPGKDGTWLLEELKKRWPEMPVIMLTAVSEATQAVECLKAGAHDYLVKPIDVDALLVAVMRGAETTELRRRARQHRKELVRTVLAFRNFEQEKRGDEMKTDFVHILSHELHAPLTAIRDALFLLERSGTSGADQDRFLEVARRNLDYLSETIDDLVDLSKIEAGEMHLDLERIAVGEPVARALASLAPQAEAMGVALKSSVPPDLPPVYGHAPSLQRVLASLIGNALKFAEPGGEVSVEIALEGEDDALSPRGGVRVTVADSGVGIAEEHLDSIFQKSHQVDSRGRAPAGAGLGLSICRELVAAHHGRIWAEHDAGRRIRVSFVIPSLSPRELLLREVASEVDRAQMQGGMVSLVLARLKNAEAIRESSGEDGLGNVMREFLETMRRVARRSSDRVLCHEAAHEVAIILSRTASDGGRALVARVLEEIPATKLKNEGVLLSVSAVEYPRDGGTAEELYERACEGVHGPTTG